MLQDHDCKPGIGLLEFGILGCSLRKKKMKSEKTLLMMVYMWGSRECEMRQVFLVARCGTYTHSVLEWSSSAWLRLDMEKLTTACSHG